MHRAARGPDVQRQLHVRQVDRYRFQRRRRQRHPDAASADRCGGQVAFGGTRAEGPLRLDLRPAPRDPRLLSSTICRSDADAGTCANMWKPLDYAHRRMDDHGLVRMAAASPTCRISPTPTSSATSPTARGPNIVSGVPLINPLYNRSCPHGTRLPAVSESRRHLSARARRTGQCAPHARWRAWTLPAGLRYLGSEELQHWRKRQTPSAIPGGCL